MPFKQQGGASNSGQMNPINFMAQQPLTPAQRLALAFDSVSSQLLNQQSGNSGGGHLDSSGQLFRGSSPQSQLIAAQRLASAFDYHATQTPQSGGQMASMMPLGNSATTPGTSPKSSANKHGGAFNRR